MKVVQINCASFGSTGNIAKEIHKQLLCQGDESYIFFGAGKATEKNMFRIGNYFSLHMHSVLARNIGKQGYFSFFSTKKLIRKIQAISPDIIHLHNLHGSYLNLPILFKYLKNKNVEVVVTLHDCWLFTGKCPHFTSVGCDRWKYSCGACPQLSVYPKSKVDNTKKNLKDKKKWFSGFGNRLRFIAVSNWLKDVAKESFLSQYSIETIYNGIDLNVFHPVDGTRVRNKYHLGNKFVILGVSSNWNEQKGLSDFLRLSEQLSDEEIIVLVGLKKEQINTMPENIIGIEVTENREELAELYSASDVFINTSKEETFGLVTAEAMACGTPVIVYNSTACAEIVGKANGIVLNGEQSIQMMEAVRMIKAGNFQICTMYTNEKMVSEYISLYRGILK